MRRLAILLAVPFLLVTAACSDDDDGEDGVESDGNAGAGILKVQLEPTDSIFIEGFEVGLRISDPEADTEIARQLWTDFIASLPPSDDINAFYDSVYELEVPAGVVRVESDVNIGMGPGPEPPDFDALPCGLDVEVPAGATVTVQVKFDDSVEDCLTVVDG